MSGLFRQEIEEKILAIINNLNSSLGKDPCSSMKKPLQLSGTRFCLVSSQLVPTSVSNLLIASESIIPGEITAKY
jgi:hypothetical protein